MKYYSSAAPCNIPVKIFQKYSKKNCRQSEHLWTSGIYTCPGACQKSYEWATKLTERKKKKSHERGCWKMDAQGQISGPITTTLNSATCGLVAHPIVGHLQY